MTTAAAHPLRWRDGAAVTAESTRAFHDMVVVQRGVPRPADTMRQTGRSSGPFKYRGCGGQMRRGGVGRAGTDAPRRLLDGHGTSCWGQQVGGRGHRHYGRVQCIETDAKDTPHRRGSPPPPTVRTRVATAGGETPLCPKRTLSRQRAARRRGDSDWRLRAGLGRGGRGTDRAAPPPLPREVTIYDVAARPDMTLHRWTGPPLRPPLARAASPRHATTHRHSRIQAFSFPVRPPRKHLH